MGWKGICQGVKVTVKVFSVGQPTIPELVAGQYVPVTHTSAERPALVNVYPLDVILKTLDVVITLSAKALISEMLRM